VKLHELSFFLILLGCFTFSYHIFVVYSCVLLNPKCICIITETKEKPVAGVKVVNFSIPESSSESNQVELTTRLSIFLCSSASEGFSKLAFCVVQRKHWKTELLAQNIIKATRSAAKILQDKNSSTHLNITLCSYTYSDYEAVCSVCSRMMAGHNNKPSGKGDVWYFVLSF